jgi:adenylate cyclase class 2
MRRMQGSTTEIEVKLRFDSPDSARERIRQLGADLLQPREFEDNVVFDRERDPLGPAGTLLRLREFGDLASLTLKARARGQKGRYKVRDEHETTVGDPGATRRILEHLGYRPCYRYQKYRTVFVLGNLHICLDETPIGCFVELEGPPEEIDRTAERLGFPPDQYILGSYRDLHIEAQRRQEVPPGDLLMEREQEASS